MTNKILSHTAEVFNHGDGYSRGILYTTNNGLRYLLNLVRNDLPEAPESALNAVLREALESILNT